MLTEIPTWATLGPVRGLVGVGHSIRVRITQDLLSLPSLKLDQVNLSPRGFLRRKGKAYIYREQNKANTPWFLASYDVTQSTPTWSHEALIEEYEPVGYGLRTLQRPLNLTLRQVRSSIKFIDFTITKDHLKEIGEDLGWDHPGLFKLTPGRLPVGIRHVDPYALQIWIPLE